MKHSIQATFILLVFVLTMTLAAGLAEESNGREIVLPEVGIAFILPEGFGENIANPDSGMMVVFHSVNPLTGFELLIGSGGDLYPNKKPTMVDKIKDKSNRYIWKEVAYGEHDFLIYRNELMSAHWNATIAFRDYYNPFIGVQFPETTEDSFPLAEEILSSVRFLSDDELK